MGDEMLAGVCELAFDVAKEGDAPSSMKNYLYLAHRPPRAYSVAQRAIEEDPSFRMRVAERATPDNVGEAGYLWLHRPSGWEHRFAEINTGSGPTTPSTPLADRPPMPEPPVSAPIAPAVEAPTPAPTVSSIEDELSNLRGLVDRLADERQNVRSSVSDLEQELETRRAENLEMSTRLSALRAELVMVHDTESNTVAERDAALARVEQLEADVAVLSADLERAQSEAKGSSAERDAAMTDLAALTAEREELLATITSLRSSGAATEARVQELSESVEQLGTVNAELKAETAKLSTDNDDLSGRLVVAERARVDLEAQLEEVSSKWQESARQLAGFADVNDQLDAAVAERDALREHLARATESVARLRTTVGTQHDQLSAELADLEDSVTSVPEAPAGQPSDDLVADAAADVDVDADADADVEEAEVVIAEDAEEFAVPGDLTVETEPFVASHDLTESPFESTAPLDVEAVADTGRAFDDASNDADQDLGVDDDDVDGPDDQPPAGGRRRIDTPAGLADDEAIARHVITVPDVVLLIDGDGVAGLGWPHLDVAARRDALGRYLSALTADSGAAADVVFQRAVGGEESLPVSRAVRVRIADDSVATSSIVANIVDGYPEEWPIAIVTDESAVAAQAEELNVTHLSNGQLLDLFLHLNTDS